MDELTPACPWCGGVFETWPQARHHVKFCHRAPRPRGQIERARQCGNVAAVTGGGQITAVSGCGSINKK